MRTGIAVKSQRPFAYNAFLLISMIVNIQDKRPAVSFPRPG